MTLLPRLLAGALAVLVVASPALAGPPQGTAASPQIGTTAGTFAAGNDSRITGALQPGGSGDVSGMSVLSTGATVLRPLAARSHDRVEAFDFGCSSVVNNAAADAGPCIQATENAAAFQRVAHFPAGKYYIQSPVNMTALTTVGDGWDPRGENNGTWFHVVSSAFMTGGSSAGSRPFTVQATHGQSIDNIAFTEDQPADASGWAPNDYGAMILVQNIRNPKFTRLYAAGVNKFMDFQGMNGFTLDRIEGQVHTYGFFIEANTDYMHASHFHWNDLWQGDTAATNITAYDEQHAVLFQSNRNDNPTFDDINAYGVNTMFAFGNQITGATTGITSKFKISNIDCDKCFFTMRITGDGTTGSASTVVGQMNGLGSQGSPVLSGSRLISVESNSNVLDLRGLRGTYTGDSVVAVTGTGNLLNISGLRAENWGSVSTSGAACNTIYAVAPGTVSGASANTISVSGDSYVSGCSGLTIPYLLGPNAGGQSSGRMTGFAPSLQFGGATTGMTTSGAAGVCSNNFSVITCQFGVSLTAKGTATGGVTVHGFPIPPNSSSVWGSAAGGGCAVATNLASMTSPIVVEIAGGGTTANLYQMTSTGLSQMTDANFTNSSVIRCSVSYFQ